MRARVRVALAAVLSVVSFACGGGPRPITPAGTVPPPSSGLRLCVGGDSRDDHAHVLPWAFQEARARGASAFLFLGDMELTPGLDGHFEKNLALLDPVPFYPVLGNHEVKTFGFLSIGTAHSEKKFRKRFLDNARTPVKSSFADRVVYSVDLPGRVHFVALDNVSQKGFGPEQLAWLAADLDAADASAEHVIVGMHKPLARNPVSKHGMESDGPQAIADSDAALELFQRHKVELLLQSHVHQFARYMVGNIQAYVTGGLGAPLDHVGPERAFHHFLQVDLDGGGLHVEVVRFPGAAVEAKEEEKDD